MKEWKEWLRSVIIAVVIALIIIQFIKPTIVKESSMEPNFYENNYLLLSRQSYTFGEPKRGDVIVFHSSLTTIEGKEKLLIKRVVGLPGDTVDINDGKVYINGEEFKEDYIKEEYTTGEIDEVVVPKGELFCMGDNRRVSIDSRYPEVGCIPIDEIVGKVIFRIYPFNEFGFIKNPFNK